MNSTHEDAHPWGDLSHHYVIRRIRYTDRTRQFVTGFPAFDTLTNPEQLGTLRGYWEADRATRHSWFTYLLVDRTGTPETVLGILRYR